MSGIIPNDLVLVATPPPSSLSYNHFLLRITMSLQRVVASSAKRGSLKGD